MKRAPLARITERGTGLPRIQLGETLICINFGGRGNPLIIVLLDKVLPRLKMFSCGGGFATTFAVVAPKSPRDAASKLPVQRTKSPPNKLTDYSVVWRSRQQGRGCFQYQPSIEWKGRRSWSGADSKHEVNAVSQQHWRLVG